MKSFLRKVVCFCNKKFGDNFQIVAQAARDHSRFQDPMRNQPYYILFTVAM
jgi:hypothetical protein